MAEPPKRFQQFLETHPEIGNAYTGLAEACENAGPLDERMLRLAKFGIAVGTCREGVVRAHGRRALGSGCTPDELRHVVLLATTTIGFPAMMAALNALEAVIEERKNTA